MKKNIVKKIIVFIPITPFIVIEWVLCHIYEIISSITEGYLAYFKRKIDK